MISYDRNSINDIPSTTGVYLFKNLNKVIYVGKSINIKARIKSHIENAKKDTKENRIINNFTTIEIVKTNYEFNAIILESQLINKYKPIYNARWKDNKSFLYIRIDKNIKYPKIKITRKENFKNYIYYGPFSSIKNIEYLLKQIRKIFPFCTQNKITKSGCFYSKIKLCNPCPNIIEQTQDQVIKKILISKYKKNIFFVKKILEGKSNIIEKDLLKKIQLFSNDARFEKAIEVRNKLGLFQRLIQQHLNSEDDYKPNYKKNLKFLYIFLKKYFTKLNKLQRIECFDISNISFMYATGSMVVAIDGELDKSKYKKFKIKRKDNQSDLFMLEEVLKRRFKNKWSKPNLLIIDGGTPQVLTALKVLKSMHLDIPILGLAKNPDRLIIGEYGLPIIRNIRTKSIFKLLILLRDESHRFAKKYHIYLRDKKFQL